MLVAYPSPPKATGQTIIPAGKPFLTKVNGKLVMAREKKDKRASFAVDLLGEAFGIPRIPRKRAKSLEGLPPPGTPLLIGNVPYFPVQSQPPTPTLPQLTFPPNVQFQQINPYQPPTQYPPANPGPSAHYSVAPPSPTEKDFDELKSINRHYSSMHGKKPHNKKLHKRMSSAPLQSVDEEFGSTSTITASNTTITITKHICANCQRIRSKKYHQEHPIKAGETPAPDFCRKCQREASSTSGSDSDRGLKKKKPKKQKSRDKSKKQKPGNGESEDDALPTSKKQPKEQKNAKETPNMAEKEDLQKRQPNKNNLRRVTSRDIIVVEEEHPLGPEPKRSHATKNKKKPRRKPSEEYIVVEYSEEEDMPRGRGRSRQQIQDSDVGTARRTLSPLANESFIQKLRSRIGGRRMNNAFPAGKRSRYKRNEGLHRSPSPEYGRGRERRDLAHPRQGGKRWYPNEQIEDSYESAISSQRSQDYPERGNKDQIHREQDNYKASSRRVPRDTREEPPRRSTITKENSFDSQDSSHSQASQRRRRERLHPDEVVQGPLGGPHVVNPRFEDETIVVTERYVYPPRSRSHIEEERRKYEHLEEPKHNRRTKFELPAEDHAYYNKDWESEEPVHRDPVKRRGSLQTYGRDRCQDSELTSNDSMEYARAYEAIHQNIPPRAPSPSSSLPGQWPQQPPYPISSDDETTARIKAARRGKHVQRDPSPTRHGSRSRSRARSTSSNHRPSYVREATDGGTEKALVPSPKRSMEIDPFHDEFSVSDMTERERQAEESSRHVTFRGPDSVVSASEAWSEVTGYEHENVRVEKVKWGGESGGKW